MLALVATVQLLALAQFSLPKEITPDDAVAEDSAPAEAPAPPSEVTDRGVDAETQNPPLPRRGERTAPPPAPPDAPRRDDGRPRQLSLLSAEPLHGGSASLAWMGWSSLGIMYGQGITPRDDLAAFGDFEWAKSELRLGAFYRRPLGKAGIFDMAGRVSAAWYLNFGADYIHDENHSDNGFEVAPALSLSARGAGGVFSFLFEGPITVTTKYGAGLLFTPRTAVAFEAPLYPELTVGLRAGIGYRAGAGDAPLPDGMAEIQFLVLAGYQLF